MMSSMRASFHYTLDDLVRNRQRPLVTCMGCGHHASVDVQAIARKLKEPDKVKMTGLLLRLKCSKCGGFADPAYKLVRADL